MIITIDIATIEYYIDTKYILYGYNDGGLTIEVDWSDKECIVALEMFTLGTVNAIRLPSYADFKTNTVNMGFVEFAHSTLTNVYVNCAMIRKVTDNGGSTTLIYFNNGQNIIVNVAYASVISSISTALKPQPLDATLTALAGLATGANKVPYSTGTDTFSQISLNNLIMDSSMLALLAAGSTIKGFTAGMSAFMNHTVANLTNKRAYYMALIVFDDCTLTGVKWGQTTQGDYTASDYNGWVLNSISSGTCTQIAATTNDGAIWKGAASSLQTKAFSSPIDVTRGLYFLSPLYCNSAQVTAPAISAATTVQWLVNGDNANSVKMFGLIAGTSTSIPATQAMSGITAQSTALLAMVY